MKHTTRNEVADMIEEATDKLRKELYLRRDSDNGATAQLVESTSEYLQQYVRDMNRAPTGNPNPVSPVAVVGPLIGSPPTGLITNKEQAYARGYADGHTAALDKVIDLLNYTSPRTSNHTLVGIVEGMKL